MKYIGPVNLKHDAQQKMLSGDGCCSTLKEYVLEKSHPSFIYRRENKEYFISLPWNPTKILCHFCPFCGKKLSFSKDDAAIVDNNSLPHFFSSQSLVPHAQKCHFLNHLMSKKPLIKYTSYFREYLIIVWRSTGGIVLDYCPDCGIHFPSSLRDAWFDTLEQQYGIKDPLHNDQDNVSGEFWSDEWWIKRGL